MFVGLYLLPVVFVGSNDACFLKRTYCGSFFNCECQFNGISYLGIPEACSKGDSFSKGLICFQTESITNSGPH